MTDIDVVNTQTCIWTGHAQQVTQQQNQVLFYVTISKV